MIKDTLQTHYMNSTLKRRGNDRLLLKAIIYSYLANVPILYRLKTVEKLR